ncbi:hypothetical protein KAR91_01660 [Candidatus Pacearchaeota archaeon]|nr:hypothetical protein [Candidatus Pacearchaeota archaeon]
MSKSRSYMRATVYEPDRCVFPAFVQPKHNGVRFLFDGNIALTREENPHCDHIQRMIKEARPWVPDGWTIDGEACFPIGSGHSLQQCQSAVKREQELSSKLIFPVFDGFNLDIPYEHLFNERLMTVAGDCQTQRVSSLETVDHYYEKWLALGYEGLIFRTNSAYRLGSGLNRLMKRKPIKHAEFIIAAVWEGQGKNAGTPVYRLWRPGHGPGEAVDKKTTFGACPDGPYDGKREMWEQRHDVVGRPLTVRFWDRYDSGVPQFPIAEAVRDYE